MKLENMKIYIITKSLVEQMLFKSAFEEFDNVEIVLDEFVNYMSKNPDIECIVSPANSYGIMDGGYDAAISEYLGWDFHYKVQKFICDNYYGEQLVGTSFIIDAPKNKKLIHTPTMVVPEVIKDDRIVYFCMRSTLMCALNNNIKSIIIPLFGAGVGKVALYKVLNHMYTAYKQIHDAENGVYYFYGRKESRV